MKRSFKLNLEGKTNYSNTILHQDVFFFFCKGMLVDEKLAIQQLSSGAKTGVAYVNLCNMGLNLTAEPYFKGLLGALYRDRIHNLLSKARILLPREEARLMIGVMDETGILEPGEVSTSRVVFTDETETLKSRLFN